MEEPLFNQLRTKEQLGYDVCCITQNVYGISGYSILVQTQADKYTTEHVDQRIEEFLTSSFSKIVRDLSEDDFDNFRDALTKEKLCADIDLLEEVRRNWNEITNCQYMFDRLEREVLAIKRIKFKNLKKWIKNTVNGFNCRKLSIHVVGSKKSNEDVKEMISESMIILVSIFLCLVYFWICLYK